MGLWWSPAAGPMGHREATSCPQSSAGGWAGAHEAFCLPQGKRDPKDTLIHNRFQFPLQKLWIPYSHFLCHYFLKYNFISVISKEIHNQ